MLGDQETLLREQQRKRHLRTQCALATLATVTLGVLIFLFVLVTQDGGGDDPLPGPTTVVLNTPLGSLRGLVEETGHVFLGVPFAEAPVGEQRFRPAVGKLAWEGVLDATSLKPACTQPQPSGSPPNYPQQSEDCLYLQVFTPLGAADSNKTYPVFFWIHGGSFMTGTGADYNGRALASRDMVVVAINYRMGPFGWLQNDQVKTENPDFPSLGGLNGVNDQLVALKWVQENIWAFGGNPDEVTIAGESAGGLSVCILSVMPAAKDLFRHSVIESGACNGPWGVPPTAYGLEKTAEFMTALNVSTLAELRQLHATTIAEHPLYRTVILALDEYLLTESPLELYYTGELVLPPDGKVMIGSNTMDTLFAFPYLAPDTPPAATTQAEFNASIATWFGDSEAASTIHSLYYPATDAEALMAWIVMNADVCLRCPTRDLSDMVAATNRTTYLYSFEYNPGVPDERFKGYAAHASEITSVFGEPAMFGGGWPYDAHLASQMGAYWASFTKEGKPSPSAGGVEWLQYVSGLEPNIVFNEEVTAATGYRSEPCNFWRGFNVNPTNFNATFNFCWQT